MPTKLRTFRLSDDDIAKLDAIAIHLLNSGIPASSRTHTVRLLIRDAHRSALALATELSTLAPVESDGESVPHAGLLIDNTGALDPPTTKGAIEFVSAKGVSPPIQEGQTIEVRIDGKPRSISLANCCPHVEPGHSKRCPLHVLGYLPVDNAS